MKRIFDQTIADPVFVVNQTGSETDMREIKDGVNELVRLNGGSTSPSVSTADYTDIEAEYIDSTGQRVTRKIASIKDGFWVPRTPISYDSVPVKNFDNSFEGIVFYRLAIINVGADEPELDPDLVTPELPESGYYKARVSALFENAPRDEVGTINPDYDEDEKNSRLIIPYARQFQQLYYQQAIGKASEEQELYGFGKCCCYDIYLVPAHIPRKAKITLSNSKGYSIELSTFEPGFVGGNFDFDTSTYYLKQYLPDMLDSLITSTAVESYDENGDSIIDALGNKIKKFKSIADNISEVAKLLASMVKLLTLAGR